MKYLHLLLLLPRIACFHLLFACSLVTYVELASAENESPSKINLKWQSIERGLEISRYYFSNNTGILSQGLLISRLNPKHFNFTLAQAKKFSASRLDLRYMTQHLGGIVGINANFFDPADKPLGLLIENSHKIQPLQSAGNLLTGIFYIDRSGAFIVHRTEFNRQKPLLAIQSGPRLIANGKALNLASPNQASRRSVVAISYQGEIILLATLSRFPGTTFFDLQKFLLTPSLKIKDALNFDGGGSSQLFINKSEKLPNEIFITGGDPVPIGLVALRKK